MTGPLAPSPWALQKALDSGDLAPGENPRGALATADWRFLLPRLDFRRVLFLGVPPGPALDATAAHAAEVLVASYTGAALPCADRSLDLVVALGGPDTSRFLRSPGFAAELDRVLTPDGVACIRTCRRRDAFHMRSWRSDLGALGIVPLGDWWLGPARRATRLAVPRNDRPVSRYFFDHVVNGVSRKARLLLPLLRRLIRMRLGPALLPHQVVVLGRRGGTGLADGAPAYLRGLAAPAGFDLAGYRAGIATQGQYDSNKVAAFLFAGGSEAPELIVKLTRAPRFNFRLEREFRSLSRLRQGGFLEEGTYPEALFLGYHEGHAALGQKALQGAPLRARTRGEASCPFANDAIDSLIRLGAASADVSAATPAEVSAWLLRLLDRFREIYSPTEAEAGFLEERIRSLGGQRAPVPLVFRHGDAGTWNVMVTGSGRVAFLDWEASEPQGPPLWDLFDFLRSFGMWGARTRGGGRGTEAYRESILADTPVSRLHAAAVERYCRRVGVDPGVVEPLFYACWISRALREAAWASGRPEEGAYFKLLRLCIHERDARGLRWIFG